MRWMSRSSLRVKQCSVEVAQYALAYSRSIGFSTRTSRSGCSRPWSGAQLTGYRRKCRTQLKTRRPMMHPCTRGPEAGHRHQRIAAARGRREEDQHAREMTKWRGEIHALSEASTPAAVLGAGQGGAAEQWSRSAPDGAIWRACARSTHTPAPPVPLCAGNAQAAAKLPTAPAQRVTGMAGCSGRNPADEPELK